MLVFWTIIGVEKNLIEFYFFKNWIATISINIRKWSNTKSKTEWQISY